MRKQDHQPPAIAVVRCCWIRRLLKICWLGKNRVLPVSPFCTARWCMLFLFAKWNRGPVLYPWKMPLQPSWRDKIMEVVAWWEKWLNNAEWLNDFCLFAFIMEGIVSLFISEAFRTIFPLQRLHSPTWPENHHISEERTQRTNHDDRSFICKYYLSCITIHLALSYLNE